MITINHTCRGFEGLDTDVPSFDELPSFRAEGVSEDYAKKKIAERETSYNLKRGWATKFETAVVAAIAVIRKDDLKAFRKESPGEYQNDKGSFSPSVYLGRHRDEIEREAVDDIAAGIEYPRITEPKGKVVKTSLTETVLSTIARLVELGQKWDDLAPLLTGATAEELVALEAKLYPVKDEVEETEETEEETA